MVETMVALRAASKVDCTVGKLAALRAESTVETMDDEMVV